MSKRISITRLVASGIAAGALLAVACDRQPVVAPAKPSFWGGGGGSGCTAMKFTGGGRIDPDESNTLSGKMTFGFNLFVDDQCNVTKGQFEVVHHPSQSRYHSVSFQSVSTFTETNDQGQTGQCFDLFLTMRAAHGPGDFDHEHPVEIQACDFGEPGSSPGTGPDTWWFATTDGSTGGGHGDTGNTPLTGGNIQAH
ncbi:MAG TPA: hypothetical protein VFK78_02770 [Gemmatimonadales bacterium]|nr:hypothetical protein [Gemmatimonadales bacterium]